MLNPCWQAGHSLGGRRCVLVWLRAQPTAQCAARCRSRWNPRSQCSAVVVIVQDTRHVKGAWHSRRYLPQPSNPEPSTTRRALLQASRWEKQSPCVKLAFNVVGEGTPIQRLTVSYWHELRLLQSAARQPTYVTEADIGATSQPKRED